MIILCFITDSSSSSEDSYSSYSEDNPSRSISPYSGHGNDQNANHGNNADRDKNADPEKAVDALKTNAPENDIVTASTSKENNDEKTSDRTKPLDDNFLKAIGKRIIIEKSFGPPLHDDLIVRWKDILKEGLPTEEKEELAKKYHQPKNCFFVEPPKISDDVKLFIAKDPVFERDERLVAKQEKVALCLAAASNLMTKIINKDTIDDVYSLEVLSDMSRLLVDLQRDENITRRALIGSNCNQWLKNLLESTTTEDEWLFGNNFGDNLQKAKDAQKTNKEIKSLTLGFDRNSKNFKSPLRRQQWKTNSKSQSGQKKTTFQSNYRKRHHHHHHQHQNQHRQQQNHRQKSPQSSSQRAKNRHHKN